MPLTKFNRQPKPFERRDTVWGIVGAWWHEMGFKTNAHGARVMDRHPDTVRRWRTGELRPDTTALRRMIFSLLWKCESVCWDPRRFKSISWDKMQVEFVEGYENSPNPFWLSPPSNIRPEPRSYQYGSVGSNSSIVRELTGRNTSDGVSLWGIRDRSHLVALLGIKQPGYGYERVRQWSRGWEAISPQYLARFLGIMMWTRIVAVPWSLEDVWAVDWEGRQITWTHRHVRECEDADLDLLDLFGLMAVYAKPPAKRKKRRRRVVATVQPAPVRTYDPMDYVAKHCPAVNGSASEIGPGQLVEAAV